MCDGSLGRLLIPDVAALRLLRSSSIDSSDLFLPVIQQRFLVRSCLVADSLFELLVELLDKFFLLLGALARLCLKRQNDLGMFEKWNTGWNALFNTLDGLTDDHLRTTVTIRGQSFEAHDALHRALAHISYHVGQIVYLAKSIRGDSWQCLSIPVGGSEAYNKNPALQDPRAHADAMRDRT